MQRTCSALLALALTLCPAVWARWQAGYPGWAAEAALRGAGCTGIITSLSSWAALPGITDAGAAEATVERVISELGFQGRAATTPVSAIATASRPGVAATVRADLRDSNWLLTVEVVCAAPAAGWYRLLGSALAAEGYGGPTHVSVSGAAPGAPAGPAADRVRRSLCGRLLASVAGTVANGNGSRVVSGSSPLIRRQPGVDPHGGTFALSVDFSEVRQATAVTISIPGLR